jgi:cell division septation protein DedD
MENKTVKSLTNLLSKTAGLVFFSFLAISLGVVFGLLFEGWVKDQPGSPVGADGHFETTTLPTETVENIKIPDNSSTQPTVDNAPANSVPAVKYKVRVGPYTNRNEAVSASQQLQSLGYPVYVGNNPPFAVQVGAFGSSQNAERLKSELTGKGYKVFVDQN